MTRSAIAKHYQRQAAFARLRNLAQSVRDCAPPLVTEWTSYNERSVQLRQGHKAIRQTLRNARECWAADPRQDSRGMLYFAAGAARGRV